MLGLPLQQGFSQGGNICLCSVNLAPGSPSENRGLDDNKMAVEGRNKKRRGRQILTRGQQQGNGCMVPRWLLWVLFLERIVRPDWLEARDMSQHTYTTVQYRVGEVRDCGIAGFVVWRRRCESVLHGPLGCRSDAIGPSGCGDRDWIALSLEVLTVPPRPWWGPAARPPSSATERRQGGASLQSAACS